MSLKYMLRAVSAAALFAAATAASAAPISLDFEGIANGSAVGNYYNGGGGTNYGVSFSANTLALVDSDAGGTGNFGNEPSPNTIMFFLTGSDSILTLAAGFDVGFSFFYTSSAAATFSVWTDTTGGASGGTLLASGVINAQAFVGCSGDPTGQFCNWSIATVSLATGTIGKSVRFGGVANQTGFDNITFGSTTPGSGPGVPEPATLALVGAALLGAAASRRAKKA
jgi:hypothetical protein